MGLCLFPPGLTLLSSGSLVSSSFPPLECHLWAQRCSLERDKSKTLVIQWRTAPNRVIKALNTSISRLHYRRRYHMCQERCSIILQARVQQYHDNIFKTYFIVLYCSVLSSKTCLWVHGGVNMIFTLLAELVWRYVYYASATNGFVQS